ncbi:hypothetical protein SEA_TINABELCHER_74 [Streptomyces phage TinaBelcher]|uniref:Uncharacterized protein n=1 Tax=Streptomyces phage Thestral TaxID=2301715 RepID=A0A385E0J3_9CAUD|nr:hypothetical protein KGG90_gp10 [Streptomyces phage Thestral]AXQ65271.1 hypothetical protein SEA_THESTRAL_76 [Streptomyces phage Thestral]QAY15732.1 hypothetical protein SEA_BOWDEN_74 [Streptomyces phage Bowden]QAY15897.1 hypothetical protein SEA_TINABELCHER_74 [Streptomyces phage TinaBelcher]
MSADIRKRTTELQALVRDVQQWRTEQDSLAPEWLALVELAEQVEGLLLALPWELQPVPTVDELIKEIGL